MDSLLRATRLKGLKAFLVFLQTAGQLIKTMQQQLSAFCSALPCGHLLLVNYEISYYFIEWLCLSERSSTVSTVPDGYRRPFLSMRRLTHICYWTNSWAIYFSIIKPWQFTTCINKFSKLFYSKIILIFMLKANFLLDRNFSP